MAASQECGEVLVHGLKNHANVSPVGPHMSKAVQQNEATRMTRMSLVVGPDVLQHLYFVDRLCAAIVFGLQDFESYMTIEPVRGQKNFKLRSQIPTSYQTQARLLRFGRIQAF